MQTIRMRPVGRRPLKDAASVAVMASALALSAGGAFAQDIDLTEVVVTGSSLRGVAPVGSDLQTVSRDEIEKTGAQTPQQILKTVPALSNTAGVSQGSMAGSSYYAPTIHSLGSSASNSTLILIDGHRMPIGGTSHPLPDPSILPPIALERVEVLADGASSTYGSDAVAGVINFITRKRVSGVEATGQVGFGDGYDTRNLGLLAGETWETASAMVAFGYSYRSSLAGDARDFFNPDQRARGGTNFNNFNCYPATVQPGGQSLVFLSPTATSGVANNATNFNCNATAYGDHLPEERRYNAMVKLEKELGDRLTVSLDGVYSDRKNMQRVARGAVQATVFRTGPQANPFYVNPPGSTAASQTIRWQADELLGPGATSELSAIGGYVTAGVEYRINDNWRANFLGLAGRDDSWSEQIGQVCGSCAFLGLNGTTNSGGNLTTPSVPGTNTIVLGLPLTADNALDVWNTGSANRTSQAMRDRLVDNRSYLRYINTIQQARASIDGSLFTLPAGEVRVAVGAEIVKYEMTSNVTRPNNTGPVSSGSVRRDFFTERLVKSGYGEIFVPVIAPDMEIPFVRALDLNVAGRYDSYAVFGSTTNPKFAVNWEIVEGFKLRGNLSKSFVAPPMTSFGDKDGLYVGSEYTTFGGQITVPVARYPEVTQLPGCANATVTCVIGASPVQGINILSGNRGLVPQTGKSWSVGADFAPTFAPGLRLSATLFNAEFKGGVTSPNAGIGVNAAALNHLLRIYPGGATQEQIAAEVGKVPIGSVLPATVYFVYNFWQRNVVNLDIQGLDLNGSYRFDTDAGAFTIGGSATHFLKFDQQIGEGAPIFSVLGTSGFNQTFASIKTQARAHLGWERGPFAADLFANYTSKYRNWSSTSVIPVRLSPEGLPAGGGDPVKANVTFDLNVSYQVSEGGRLGDSQLYVDVSNLFDKDPPFFNGASGYNNYAGNPIGRVVSLGVRSRF